MSNRKERHLGALSIALIVTTIILFVATGILYLSQSRQRASLTATIRSSGWVAYQAQLEYVKAEAEIDRAALSPTPEALQNVGLRLEILRSRLPLLYNSDEGRLLQNFVRSKSEVQKFEVQLDGMLDRVPTLQPNAPSTSDTLRGFAEDLRPLGGALQNVLMRSVAYNEELFRRERAAADTPVIVPLVLLFISGASLGFVLFLQARRDRRRLDTVIDAQAAVVAMEENLRSIVAAVPACMIVVDPAENAVNFVNSHAALLIDPSPFHPEWRRFIRAALEAAGDDVGQTFGALSMAYSRPQGDVVSLRGSLCRVIWEGRPQMLVVLVDTTAIRNAELQVMQAAKLATLGEMATAIAHELNQPLAVIKMAVANAKRLVLNGASSDLVRAKLDRISAQVDRAKRITDQVRRYGRMPSEEAAPFQVRQALDLAVGFVVEQYRESDIRLSIDNDVPAEITVAGVQTMFEQVIVNILINARDAFEGRTSRFDFRMVSVRARCRGPEVIIEVEDNAGGIADDMLARLFEPFSTTKPADKGTGLGLSLARSVVRDMDGTITAENRPGGARFIVALPIGSTSHAQDAA